MPAPDTSPAPIAVGQKLGKYVLTEKLGEGGMGMVFAGVHETLGREVAVKFLRGEFAKNEQVVARFQQEAEAVSRIGHANIVAVYDFGRLEDGSLYYIMEKIVGETLTRRMKREPLMSLEEIGSLYAQTCRALAVAHSRKIVHRDLKPDNIMLQPKADGLPHVKIVDFGVAKMREAGAEGDGKLTKSGTILGTPTYMAPEQITNPMAIDGRADQYALGSMLYEILTGEPPFGRGDMLATMQRHVREAAAPPSTKTARRTISTELDSVVLRALAKNPADRYPDINGFLAALTQALGIKARETGPLPLVVATPNAETIVGENMLGQVEAAPPKKTGLFIGAGVAVALVAVGIAAFALRGKPQPTPADPAAGGGGAAVPSQPVALVQQTPLQIEANKALGAALGSDAMQRRLAVDAMAEVGDHSAIDQVITALGDDNPEVRRAAANAAIALARPEDTALRGALAEAAQRSGGQVAIDIAAARLRTGDAAAEVDLRRALETRDPVSRLRAAVALASEKKVPASALRAAIQSAPPTVRRSLRWSAYVQLFKLGDPAFAGELKTALNGADPSARLDAAQTFARGGDAAGREALADLATKAPDPLDRVDAAAVLAELNDVGAVKTLLEALGDQRPPVRARAATSLGRLAQVLPQKDDVEEKLRVLLVDKEAAPRIAAAAALLALEGARTARTP